MAALALVALTLPAAVGGVPSGSSGGKVTRGGTYIVQLADLPVVAYEGEVAGLKGTAPTNGKKIDPIATDVTKYVAYLTGKHDKVLASVGATAKLYDYVYSFNGMAARLTAAQHPLAEKLAHAHYVIDTSRGLDYAEAQVRAIIAAQGRK